MNTSFQSVTVRAAKAAVVNAAKRASVSKADADRETRFHDLLSDRKAREVSSRADGAPSGTQARVMATGRPPTGVSADRSVPPSAQAVSIQQGMLAVPTVKEAVIERPDDSGAADGADDPETVDTPIGPQNSPTEPHGQPVALDRDDGTSTANGGVKSSPVFPHSPPILDDYDDRDQGGIRASTTDPHGPLIPEVGDSSLAGDPKLSLIMPHGRTVSPGDRAVVQNTATDVRNHPLLRAKNDEAATVAAQRNTLANSIRTEGPATTTFLITTATQAQLAVSAEAPVNPADAEWVTVSTSRAANFASRVGQVPIENTGPDSGDLSQDTKSEVLPSHNSSLGTSNARGQETAMSYPTNSESAHQRAAVSTRDTHAFEASDLPDGRSGDSLTGRAKDGDAAKASAAATLAQKPSAVTAQPAFVPAENAAPSTGILHVDRIETLLQTVHEMPAQVQFDGTGQLELRVRLEGVADEVTVRVHLDENKQTQVSFQTSSPELRAALEQGWSDLTASPLATPSSSPASPPYFPPAQPKGTAVPSDPHRDDRQASGLPSFTPTEQPTRRWSVYA